MDFGAPGPASAPNFCASIMLPLTFILPAMKAWARVRVVVRVRVGVRVGVRVRVVVRVRLG